ncbi:hypothetical protein B0T17DRAFT_542063 [Bombardia bombarda]|uniref:Secreted protein n=1 Tax=Bombardia bombarda TaxID=252184 RepID=A0AA39U7Q9_9PEZI|nr:hypothetical protein B0T17DRAFT_542063 [Bombardia bombarda]
MRLCVCVCVCVCVCMCVCVRIIKRQEEMTWKVGDYHDYYWTSNICWFGHDLRAFGSGSGTFPLCFFFFRLFSHSTSSSE